MRFVPEEFNLLHEKPILQKFPEELVTLLEGNSEKVKQLLSVKKSEFNIVWKHDWKRILSEVGIGEKLIKEILDILTITDKTLIMPPTKQGNCDSCWAVVVAASLTDRFRIAYQDSTFPVLSPSTLMHEMKTSFCCSPNLTRNACNHVMKRGIPILCCAPYSIEKTCDQFQEKDQTCVRGNDEIQLDQSFLTVNCESIDSTDARYYTSTEYKDIVGAKMIKEELLFAGSLIAEVILFPDLLSCKSNSSFSETGGIYMHSECCPRYLSNLKEVLKATSDVSATDAEFFINTIAPYGEDLTELWELSQEELSLKLGELAPILDYIQVGFYGKARKFIFGEEVKYGQHAMLIIGWGVEKNVEIENYGVKMDIPYWILKNSYGTDWCNDGYVKVAFSSLSHSYPDLYFTKHINNTLGVEHSHLGPNLENSLPSARESVCSSRMMCGGAISPGLPDIQKSSWKSKTFPIILKKIKPLESASAKSVSSTHSQTVQKTDRSRVVSLIVLLILLIFLLFHVVRS